MKKLSITLLLLVGILGNLLAQKPVNYTWKVKALTDDTYQITFKTKIETGWYTYSQYLESDLGPIPTSINFESTNQKKIGKATETTSKSSNKVSGHDDMFDMNITKYKKDITIVQKFQVTNPTQEVSGYLEYMTCNDSQCLPPTAVEFSFIPSSFLPKPGERPQPNDNNNNTPEPKEKPTNNTTGQVDPVKNNNTPTVVEEPTTDPATSEEEPIAVTGDTTPTTAEVPTPAPTVKEQFVGTTKDGIFNPVRPTLVATAAQPIGDACESATGEVLQNNNVEVEGLPWWKIFLLGFGGGLLALLTPCVFPMIPMTVSLFSKGSGGKSSKSTGIKNALIFGASIIVIYVSLGLAFTIAFGPEAINLFSTSWIMNLLFFILFTVFAFSFFGYYEIQLPSSWANKADQASSKGGLAGTFFGAFSIALVSFSCTGPIIGSLIMQTASSGSYGSPAIGMLGFSVALALPFMLFAIFPSWLQSLPKSGGWMTSMKVILGFLEIALGLKFLSTADLTEHWGILPYEVFVGLWALTFLLMTLYLFGFIRFPHDAKGAKISMGRKVLGGVAALVTVSLLSGFMVNPQTDAFKTPFWLSGLAPSACYSYIRPCQQAQSEEYSFSDHCPPGINQCFDDYDEALRYATANNKPILVDFTGYGCVNCRKMEENVWIDPSINKILNEDYVLVSLYVDDRKKLPQTLVTEDGTKIRNVGNKWAAFQRVNFNKLAQPYYVLITPEEEVINVPRAYTPDIATYEAFLRCGLDGYQKSLTE
ncbi:MAG: cytochrome c biogenesis protein CcdA [Aureispira sp.]